MILTPLEVPFHPVAVIGLGKNLLLRFVLGHCGNTFLTCSWRFLRSNKLEQLELKLEKIIGIQKSAGKVRKVLCSTMLELHSIPGI